VRQISLVISTVFLLVTSAQVGHAQKGEASANYSFVDYNPAKSLAGSLNLNGGGGSIGLNIGEYLTLKSEFESYATTTVTYHLQSPPYSAAGTIKTHANMFTYMFGPQFNFYKHRTRLFGEALFGGAYTNGYTNLFKSANVTSLSASNNGFAMAFGGGIDLRIAKHFAVRPAQFDYFMTRYEWKPLGINNQSNFRYQAGIVFPLGHS
jgi:hypothetical protein